MQKVRAGEDQPTSPRACTKSTYRHLNGRLFYADIAFNDFNTIGLDRLKRRILLQGALLIQRYEKTKNSCLDLVFADDLLPEHIYILVLDHE